MLHRFHRLEVHGIVLENCMHKSTERKLTMETVTVRHMVMKDSEKIIQDVL